MRYIFVFNNSIDFFSKGVAPDFMGLISTPTGLFAGATTVVTLSGSVLDSTENFRTGLDAASRGCNLRDEWPIGVAHAPGKMYHEVNCKFELFTDLCLEKCGCVSTTNLFGPTAREGATYKLCGSYLNNKCISKACFCGQICHFMYYIHVQFCPSQLF